MVKIWKSTKIVELIKDSDFFAYFLNWGSVTKHFCWGSECLRNWKYSVVDKPCRLKIVQSPENWNSLGIGSLIVECAFQIIEDNFMVSCLYVNVLRHFRCKYCSVVDYWNLHSFRKLTLYLQSNKCAATFPNTCRLSFFMKSIQLKHSLVFFS